LDKKRAAGLDAQDSAIRRSAGGAKRGRFGRDSPGWPPRAGARYARVNGVPRP